MSVRHLNYTGRKRIAREHVKVAITGDAPEARVVASFELATYGFPGTSRLVLEAQAGWTVQRFEFGSVDVREPPPDSRLSEFSTLVGLLFRLKVVGTGDSVGRILGEAERLRPTSTVQAASQRSFIVVRPADLGHVAWELSFDEAQPLLLVNKRLGDHHDFLRRRDVVALVLPEVLRKVLVEALDVGADEEDLSGWESQVITFGERLAGVPCPNPDDREAVDSWLETVVGEFARRHRLLDGLIETLRGGE